MLGNGEVGALHDDVTTRGIETEASGAGGIAAGATSFSTPPSPQFGKITLSIVCPRR